MTKQKLNKLKRICGNGEGHAFTKALSEQLNSLNSGIETTGAADLRRVETGGAAR